MKTLNEKFNRFVFIIQCLFLHWERFLFIHMYVLHNDTFFYHWPYGIFSVCDCFYKVQISTNFVRKLYSNSLSFSISLARPGTILPVVREIIVLKGRKKLTILESIQNVKKVNWCLKMTISNIRKNACNNNHINVELWCVKLIE